VAYLLDSDVVIDHLADEPDVVRLVDDLASAGLFMSAVSYMEASQGIDRGPDADGKAAALAALATTVPVLPFSVPEARRCAAIRESFRRQGRRVNSRALDLMIAATAIEHGLILVSRNTRDYRDVPDLQLYQSS
jgi:tRNA(fMet)-specific endonuclease VapC